MPTEAEARRALAARGMPEAQNDRVVERRRSGAERDGRALPAVPAEMLAAPPGEGRKESGRRSLIAADFLSWLRQPAGW